MILWEYSDNSDYGKVDELLKVLDIHLEKFPTKGRITRDAYKQIEYLTVSLINTFMIASIQGGLYPPDANAIADLALRQLSMKSQSENIPNLISETAIKLCKMVRTSKSDTCDNIHVEKAKQFISSHITQDIHINDIATSVGLSPYHLSRLFKVHTGHTIMEYLCIKRIEIAKSLLQIGEKSIPEIASLLYFCDQSHFTYVFKKKQVQLRPNTD